MTVPRSHLPSSPAAPAERAVTVTLPRATAPCSVSIVIPTWNEATIIGPVVRGALNVADEVIVADAGSPDGTAEAARQAGARVVETAKGRGNQLRVGASKATGDVLLFLHADATLAPTARIAIEHALQRTDHAGGNFRLHFTPGDNVVCRLFSEANHLRRKWFRVYYGDSGIFVRRSVYEALGGFQGFPVFEDYDFVRRLERQYKTVYLADETIAVSGRRFAERPLQVLMIWAWMHLRLAFGASPWQLAKLYSDKRASTSSSF